MAGVALRWRGQQPVVNTGDVLETFSVRLPLDVALPQPVRTELQSASGQRPLELGTHELLVVGLAGPHVLHVVDPEVDRERDGLQSPLEHLRFQASNIKTKEKPRKMMCTSSLAARANGTLIVRNKKIITSEMGNPKRYTPILA